MSVLNESVLLLTMNFAITLSIKLTAFADDLTTFLQGIQSFERLSITIDRFGICSGLKLNTEKTEALWPGKYHDNPPHVNIEKIDKPMKILGVFFTYDWRKRQELNFEEILKSLSKSMKRWELRNLTLYGKIQVVKTFVIPKFMFRASLISLTKNIIKLVDSTIYSFIWKGRDKIKRLALISDYKNRSILQHGINLAPCFRIVMILIGK